MRIKVTKRLRDKTGDKSVLEISLREGRNRQVRRMLAKIGNKVRELTRIKLGPLTLHGLGPGQVRELTSREIRELRSMKDREPVARRPDDDQDRQPQVARPVRQAKIPREGRNPPRSSPARTPAHGPPGRRHAATDKRRR